MKRRCDRHGFHNRSQSEEFPAVPGAGDMTTKGEIHLLCAPRHSLLAFRKKTATLLSLTNRKLKIQSDYLCAASLATSAKQTRLPSSSMGCAGSNIAAMTPRASQLSTVAARCKCASASGASAV